MKMNKKGLDNEVIFIILNCIIFSTIMYFIFLSSSNALVYEQSYAKQIALLIDSSRPNMTLSIDISKAMEFVEKDKLDLNKIFKIDNENKYVFVSLNKKGGYKFNFISNNSIEYRIDGNNLNLIIK